MCLALSLLVAVVSPAEFSPASSLLQPPCLRGYCLLCSISTSALRVCWEIKSWLLIKCKIKFNLIVKNSAVISRLSGFFFSCHTEINTILATEIGKGLVHLALCYYFYCGNCNFCRISLYKAEWWIIPVQGDPRMTELWNTDPARLVSDFCMSMLEKYCSGVESGKDSYILIHAD